MLNLKKHSSQGILLILTIHNITVKLKETSKKYLTKIKKNTKEIISHEWTKMAEDGEDCHGLKAKKFKNLG